MNEWTSSRQREFESLLIALLEDENSPEVNRRLSEMMHEFPAARELYIRTMAMHAQLHVVHADPDRKASPVAAAGKQPDAGPWQRLRRFAARPTPLSIAVAFVFV